MLVLAQCSPSPTRASPLPLPPSDLQMTNPNGIAWCKRKAAKVGIQNSHRHCVFFLPIRGEAEAAGRRKRAHQKSIRDTTYTRCNCANAVRALLLFTFATSVEAGTSRLRRRQPSAQCHRVSKVHSASAHDCAKYAWREGGDRPNFWLEPPLLGLELRTGMTLVRCAVSPAPSGQGTDAAFTRTASVPSTSSLRCISVSSEMLSSRSRSRSVSSPPAT